MIKSAEYIQFEEGFLKEAEDNGIDSNFLRGFIKQAEEIQDKWAAFYDLAAEESGDPLFKIKLASELTQLATILKQANEDQPQEEGYGLNQFDNDAQGQFKQIGDWANPYVGQFMPKGMNTNALGGGIAGAGGGGLLGLLLGQLTGHPMLGMMLGGLGGAGLGGLWGQGKIREWFGDKGGQSPAPAPHGNPNPNPNPEPQTTPNPQANPNPQPSPTPQQPKPLPSIQQPQASSNTNINLPPPKVNIPMPQQPKLPGVK